MVQGKHHHAACLSKLLIHGGQIVIPSRIMYQIELMDCDSIEQILEGTKEKLKIRVRMNLRLGS